jgi:hypothetical protein
VIPFDCLEAQNRPKSGVIEKFLHDDGATYE